MGFEVTRTSTGTEVYTPPLEVGSPGFDAGTAVVESPTTGGVSVGVSGPALQDTTQLTITHNGEDVVITDPALIAQIQAAAEAGDWGTVAVLVGGALEARAADPVRNVLDTVMNLVFSGGQSTTGPFSLSGFAPPAGYAEGEHRGTDFGGGLYSLIADVNGQSFDLLLKFESPAEAESAGTGGTDPAAEPAVVPGVLSVEQHDDLQFDQVFTLAQSLLTVSGGYIPSDWSAADFIAYVFGFNEVGGLTQTPEWAEFTAQLSKPGALNDPGSLDYSMFNKYFPGGDASGLSTLVSQGVLLQGTFTALGDAKAGELNEATFTSAYGTVEEGHIKPEHGRRLHSEALAKFALENSGKIETAAELGEAGAGRAFVSLGGPYAAAGLAGYEIVKFIDKITYHPPAEPHHEPKPVATFGQQYQESTTEAFIGHIRQLLDTGTSEDFQNAVDLLITAGRTLPPEELHYVLDSIPTGSRLSVYSEIRDRVSAESGGSTNYFDILYGGRAYSRLEDIAFAKVAGHSDERSGAVDSLLNIGGALFSASELGSRLASLPPETAAQLVGLWTQRVERQEPNTSLSELADALTAFQKASPEGFDAMITTLGSADTNLQDLLKMLNEVGGPAENALAGRILEALPVAQRAELLSDLTGIPVADLSTNLAAPPQAGGVYEFVRNLSSDAQAETRQYLTDATAAATAAGNDYGFASLTTPGARAIYLENLNPATSAEDPAILLATLPPEEAAAVVGRLTVETALDIFNSLPPEKAAAILDLVPPHVFETVILNIDVDKALAVHPLLKASQLFTTATQRQELAVELSAITGIDAALIMKLLDGTATFDEVVDLELYNLIPLLQEKIESRDAGAIKFVENALGILLAAGSSGDPGDPGGWGANETAFLKDLGDAALGRGAYSGAPDAAATTALLQLLSTSLGAVRQSVIEGAELRYLPEAVGDLTLDQILAQNPEAKVVVEDIPALTSAALTDLSLTADGQALLASYGYQVIGGELYYASGGGGRNLQQNTTGTPSGAPTYRPSHLPSGWPTAEPSFQPTSGPSVGPSGNYTTSPSTSPTGEPVKVELSAAEAFISTHVRVDVAVEITFKVGPGATVSQYRGFIRMNPIRNEDGGIDYTLRLRQLTSVAPENVFSTAGNWISTKLFGSETPFRVARETAAYFGAHRTVFDGNSGILGVKDFVFNNSGGDFRKEDGKVDWRYQSTVGVYSEIGNQDNAVPYQIANWTRTHLLGQRVEYYPGTEEAGTPIDSRDVVSSRHATSNALSATENLLDATGQVQDIFVRRAAGLWEEAVELSNRWIDLAEQYTTVTTPAQAAFTAGITTVTDVVSSAVARNGQFSATWVQASNDFSTASGNLNTATDAYEVALGKYALLFEGNRVPTQQQLDVATRELDTAKTNLDNAVEDYKTKFQTLRSVSSHLGLTATELQVFDSFVTSSENFLNSLDVYNDVVPGLLEASVDYFYEVTALLANDPDGELATALRELSDAVSIFNARDDQAGRADQYWGRFEDVSSVFPRLINGTLAAGQNLFSSVDFEMGVVTSITGVYTEDTLFLGFTDIVLSVGGEKALNYSVGLGVWDQFGATGPNTDVTTYVGAIQTGFSDVGTFLGGVFQETPELRSNSAGLLGGYAASLVWSQLIAPTIVDNPIISEYPEGSYSREQGVGYYIAPKPRATFGPNGQFFNSNPRPFKSGGRVQINIGYDYNATTHGGSRQTPAPAP